MLFLLLRSPDEDWRPDQVLGRVGRGLERVAGRTPTTWALGALFAATTTPDQLLLREFGGKVYLLDGTLPCHLPLTSERELLQCVAAAGGCYNLFTWDASSGDLFVTSEENAFRPLYVHVRPTGTVAIASHIGLIAEAFQDLNVNEHAVLEQLAVSACTSNRTTLEGVTRIEPGAVVYIDGKHRLKYSAGTRRKQLSVSPADAGAEVWRLTEAVLTEALGKRSAVVALSGGFDSRFLALAGTGAGLRLAAVTLGLPGWIDVDLATSFAYQASIPHRLVEPPRVPDFDDYRATVIEVEHMSDYLSPFWLGTYRGFLRAWEGPVINGFLGGPVSGGLKQASQTPNEEPGDVVEAYMDAVNRCAVRWDTLRRVSTSDVTQLRQGVLGHARKLSVGHSEPTRHLEMRLRQYGFVVLNTVNLYRRYCSVVAPFADARIIGFFQSLSPGQLANQRFYRQALEARDSSGVPFASTTARLYRPETFTRGPMEYLYASYAKVRHTMLEFVLAHRQHIEHMFHVDTLAREMIDATVGEAGPDQMTFTEAIALVNSVIWIVQRGLHESVQPVASR